jgi:processing peptidase subunit alpha
MTYAAAARTALSRSLFRSKKIALLSNNSVVSASVAPCIPTTAITATASQRQPRRSFSSGQSFSSFQYPNATEPPQVTSTTAAQAQAETTSTSSTTETSRSTSPTSATSTSDAFDDGNSLSDAERESLRQDQKKKLETKLSGSTAITPNVPSSIPPNVPADQLETPETMLTTLPNGVRVVSQETYGQVSTVGVVSDVGSRLEVVNQGASTVNQGVTNLLEVLAFGATRQHSGMQVTELLQDWGGTRFVSTGREQTLHCIDLLRPNVDKAVDLLKQVLLEAQFLPEEVQDAKRALEFQALDLPPELLLGEGLQTAAFGRDQQLGQSHFCPAEALPNLSAETVHDFWQRQFVQNPAGLVLAGAGVEHDFLVELADKHFGHLLQVDGDRTLVQPCVYRGGEDRCQQPSSQDGFIRVALGLEVGGWHSDDLVATCVLQTLLGGGNSFSAGGPGKGMYSRLYRQVLNRYGWAESAEAFTAFHSESGLWGISGSTVPHKARDMIQVFAEHLARLAVEQVSDEELDRARNMLKCNVLTQLESRLVLFEDLGRQVLTYGQREDMHTTCEKIDAVTKEDLKQLALRALSQPPTLASVGHDLTHVPLQEEVAQWFR